MAYGKYDRMYLMKRDIMGNMIKGPWNIAAVIRSCGVMGGEVLSIQWCE